MGQMRCHAVTVVGHEGATRATLLPSRAEHEVLHQQLPAALEQVGKAAPALGCVENVILVDAHPRQRAALAGDPVTQVRQFFFLRQRSEEHTSELQSLMRISYAVFCLKKKTETTSHTQVNSMQTPTSS